MNFLFVDYGLGTFITLVYIVGIGIHVSLHLMKHKNEANQEDVLSPATVRLAFIWPAIFLFRFNAFFIYWINEMIYVALLLTGYHYNKSRLYKFIKRETDL